MSGLKGWPILLKGGSEPSANDLVLPAGAVAAEAGPGSIEQAALSSTVGSEVVPAAGEEEAVCFCEEVETLIAMFELSIA